jgi:EmrB/QacA subfamily drug resistance transporter
MKNNLKYVLPVLVIGNLLCMMDVSIMTIVLPEIQSAFNNSLSNLSWAINIYTIIFAALIIPFGKLAEKFGRNKFVLIGLTIFGIGSFLTGISSNLTFMLMSRAIQSIGAAIIIPTSMVIGLEISNQNNRNKVVAVLRGVQGLAVALGPAIGGIVAQYWGWRWVFFMNIPLLILDLIIFPFVLPLTNEKKYANHIDWLGSLLSIITLTTLSLGLIKGNNWGWTSQTTVTLFTSALLAFILFIWLENKIKYPMINMKLFKNRNFNGAGLSLLLSNFFLGGFVILIPTFLTKIHNQNEMHAALLITPYSLAVMFSVIITSLLIKKLNKRLLVGSGFLLIAWSYYQLANLKIINNNFNSLIFAGITLGIGYGMIVATANILAVSDFHGDILTASQSVANVLRQVGIVLAIAIFMTILSNNISSAKQNTLDYGYKEVNATTLNRVSKQRVKTKLRNRFNSNTNTTSNTNNIKYKDIHISKYKRKKITNTVYFKKINNPPLNKLPDSTRIKIKSKIAKIVNQKLNILENKINP